MRTFILSAAFLALTAGAALAAQDGCCCEDMAEGQAMACCEDMAEEERGHRASLFALYRERFGEHLPPIRRDVHVAIFVCRLLLHLHVGIFGIVFV